MSGIIRYVRDGQTDGQKQRLLPRSLRSGHNNKKNCAGAITLLKLTTDGHKASRGLSATAELLVCGARTIAGQSGACM